MTIINMENKIDQPILKQALSAWKGVLSEFISTFMLVLLGCMSCVPLDESAANPPLVTPIAFGLVVLFNIQIFGHISGAYMNPFVTIIAAIFGRVSIIETILYIIVQCAGAILGYGLLITMTPGDIAAEGLCTTVPHNGITDFQAFGVEIVITVALSLINCAVWDPVNAHNTDCSPLKFGLTVIALSIVGGPLSGASMNPARTLGPAVWTGRWDAHWIYWAGPLIGGIVPALFYKYTWMQKKQQ